jgi:hypothetical protein
MATYPLTRPPTAGWSASIPLSITPTLTPAPVLPSQAHAGVIVRNASANRTDVKTSGAKSAL